MLVGPGIHISGIAHASFLLMFMLRPFLTLHIKFENPEHSSFFFLFAFISFVVSALQVAEEYSLCKYPSTEERRMRLGMSVNGAAYGQPITSGWGEFQTTVAEHHLQMVGSIPY